MKACIVVVLLGVLAGCSSSPRPGETPEAAACRQKENDDPNVKALLIQASTEYVHPEFQEKLEAARRKSVHDCLAAQGLAPRGGVEPLQGAQYPLGRY